MYRVSDNAMSLIPIRFHIRLISRLDSQQLVEVEKDAFPTLWPPTSFNREINNKLAVYLVAVALDDVSDIPYVTSEIPAPPSLLSRAASLLRRLLPGTPGPGNDDYILGYLGLWDVVDDAHVVSVGVRTPFRRHGVGEALLIRAIETAMGWGSRYITLEVRVSNGGAQTLYDKYGFKKVGVRKRYYLDNNEDAHIMTTDSILTPEYQAHFEQLKALHSKRVSLDLQPAPPIDLPAQ